MRLEVRGKKYSDYIMKFCVKHFLKILFILSLGLCLNGIAKSPKPFTKNPKNLHSSYKSTQNQFLLDIEEEEEIEEEVKKQNLSNPTPFMRNPFFQEVYYLGISRINLLITYFTLISLTYMRFLII